MLFHCLLAGLPAASAICNSKMVSFACSEVAQVSRASGAVFAFLVSDVLVLQRFQFQLGKSNDFLSTAVNRTLFIEGADAKKMAHQRRS